MIIPAYWIFRTGTKAVLGQVYKKYEVVARPAFTNPLPLNMGAVTVLPAAGGGFTAYAKVTNPNAKLSGTTASFQARFANSAGQQVYQTSGQFYIGPGGETYIVVPRFLSSEQVRSGAFEVTNVRWQQKFSVPVVGLSAPAPIVFAEKDGARLEGTLINNSPYKLSSARLVVFLYAADGTVVSVGERAEFTVLPQERRAYVLRFPGVEPGSFARAVPVVVETNTSDVSNIQTPDGRLEYENITPKR